jgi:DNA-binding response OmpR family regulator
MLKSPSGKKGMGIRILLVEDDFFVRDVYQKKLNDEGFTVDSAGNGLEGMERLREHIPDLILLDIFMPYVDGKDMLLEIRQHDEWKGIPIILLTNLADNEGVRFGFGQGVEEFLIKSHFTPSEVVQKIYVVLERCGKSGILENIDESVKQQVKSDENQVTRDLGESDTDKKA